MANPSQKDVVARLDAVRGALTAIQQAMNVADPAQPLLDSTLKAAASQFAQRVVPAVAQLADLLEVPIAPPAAAGAGGAGFVAAAPAERPPASSFAEFVGEVGKAMVAAQQGLDVASNLYSQGGGPLVAPTSYRIPKLTASMRFALEKTKERGFDLLIYSSTQTARELNQQTLDLELVAVPAAPEFAAAIAARRPRFTLLGGAAQRAGLVEALLKDLAHDAAPALEAVRDAPERVVFAAGSPRPSGSSALVEDVLVLFTTPDPPGPRPGQAGAWYMTVLDGSPQADAAPLVPFGDAADGSAQRLLHNLAEPLCAAQAALLKQAGD